MKKFTNINNIVKENSKKKDLKFKEKILEFLNITIDGVKEPWNKKINIEVDNEIELFLQSEIDKKFLQEKISLFEKFKMSIFNKDISWIDNEIEKINENLKRDE